MGKIEWTDRSDWNPLRGCSRSSPGCGGGCAGPKKGGCYAEVIAGRFCYPGGPFESFAVRTKAGARWTGKVALIEDRLTLPLRWKKPAAIFACSMSDLFHEALPDADIDRIFAVMEKARRHTFQVLTKRAERMRDYLVRRAPLPNVWIGVSVEDRLRLDRIEALRTTPAAVRWVSFEPLLEDLGDIRQRLRGIDWAVLGAESGKGARPCELAWLRSVRDQCRAAGAAVFVKQLTRNGRRIPFEQWPEDLRVRQYPIV